MQIPNQETPNRNQASIICVTDEKLNKIECEREKIRVVFGDEMKVE